MDHRRYLYNSLRLIYRVRRLRLRCPLAKMDRYGLVSDPVFFNDCHSKLRMECIWWSPVPVQVQPLARVR